MLFREGDIRTNQGGMHWVNGDYSICAPHRHSTTKSLCYVGNDSYNNSLLVAFSRMGSRKCTATPVVKNIWWPSVVRAVDFAPDLWSPLF